MAQQGKYFNLTIININSGYFNDPSAGGNPATQQTPYDPQVNL